MGMDWPVSSDKWKAPLVTYLTAQLPLGGSFAIHCEPRSPHALRVLDHGYVLIKLLQQRWTYLALIVLVKLARQSFFFLVAAICQAKRAF